MTVVAAEPEAPGVTEQLEMLETMTVIRRVEERLGEDYKAGRLPGTVHLYIGQEAVAVGVCAHLRTSDRITSTHRGHGHYIAKGGDLDRMVAEVYGRATGACKGVGGSMHICDWSKGILGANAIVGGGVALATGAALAAQLDASAGVAVCFFGDGAATQGVLYEALNLAAVWKLPLVLVCENNEYSQYTPTATVLAGEISARCSGFEVPAISVDGNDVQAVWTAAGKAIRRARSGGGPTLIEPRTYRLRGHLEAEVHFIQGTYRDPEEVAAWARRDPIARFAAELTKKGHLTPSEWAAIEQRAATRVAQAVAFAESSPVPDPQILNELMFVGQAS